MYVGQMVRRKNGFWSKVKEPKNVGRVFFHLQFNDFATVWSSKGATTLSIRTFSIMTPNIITLSITTLSIMTLSIMTLSIMTLSIMTLSIMMLVLLC